MDEDDEEERKIELGPQCTLKEQLEKDKVLFFVFSSETYMNFSTTLSLVCVCVQDDESLRRWKEQLLGSVDINSVGGNCVQNWLPFIQFLSVHVILLYNEIIRTF